MTTRSILHRIACKGYAVNLRRDGGTVHAEAIDLNDPSHRLVSRTLDGDDEPQAHQAARELAKMAGIKLESEAP